MEPDSLVAAEAMKRKASEEFENGWLGQAAAGPGLRPCIKLMDGSRHSAPHDGMRGNYTAPSIDASI